MAQQIERALDELKHLAEPLLIAADGSLHAALSLKQISQLAAYQVQQFADKRYPRHCATAAIAPTCGTQARAFRMFQPQTLESRGESCDAPRALINCAVATPTARRRTHVWLPDRAAP